MSVKIKDFQYLFGIVLTLVCFSCNDASLDDTMSIASNGSGWISNLGLEANRGELSIDNSNNHLIVGSDYILQVDVNGNVIEEMQDPFAVPASGLFTISKIFDDKIYRFTSISVSNDDSEKNIELEIYDKNGSLLESKVLEATYTLIDAIIEENKMTLLTWNWNDPNTLGASTHIFQVNNNGQLIFANGLTDFPAVTGRVFDLIKLGDGNFLFEYDKTLYKASSLFEPISFFELSNTVHTFMEGPSGNIYVGGIVSSGNTNYLLKLDQNLNQVNEVTFNNELLDPAIPALANYAFGSVAVHDEKIYTLEVAYEYAHELRLQCFDLDFNKNSELVLEGSGPLSNLLINELGNVSFLYGNPYAPFDEYPDLNMPTEARLFKMEVDCQLPEVIISN